MRKLIFAVIAMLMCGSVHAQTDKTLSELDKAFKQAKSSATIMALMGDLEQAVPATESDMAILGDFLDKYPEPARKAALKIKDRKLTKSVIRECRKRIDALNLPKEKNWDGLPQEERFKRVNGLMNVYALMAVLGNLKDKEAVPFLKQYITPEYDGVLSYNASQTIGKISPDDPAIFKELWEKNDVKSINYGAYGKSLLKEVSQKLQDGRLSETEKQKLFNKARVGLLNGRDPEEKKLLKEIVLNHPDEYLRKEAGLAMTKALMFHPAPDDVEFVLKWTKDPKDTSAGQAIIYMRDNFNPRYVPVLINYLKHGVYGSDRLSAVEVLKKHKIKEALPHIKNAIINDKDSNVRGSCRIAYWELTGEMPADFTPEDANELEKYLSRPKNIRFYEMLDASNPRKKKMNALKTALSKYRANTGR